MIRNSRKNISLGPKCLIFLFCFWSCLGVSWEPCSCLLEFLLWGFGSKILEKLDVFEGFWKCNLLILWRYWCLSWAYLVLHWPILSQDGLQNGLQKLSEIDHKVVKKSLPKLVKKYPQKCAKKALFLWNKIDSTGVFLGVPEALGLSKNVTFQRCPSCARRCLKMDPKWVHNVCRLSFFLC